MVREMLSTHEKALQINLDVTSYGAFAEIGAGQEVARWFFRVGGAAGTIAKTISAYDMAVSDAIYGPCKRYVSRQRLQTMLAYEYSLQYDRLNYRRGANTRFFVFANTVAARSFRHAEEGQGWMGLRFQTQPAVSPSEIIIHVRMLDRENVQQQETLGTIGVNLVYGALQLHAQPDVLLKSLMDNLTSERAEVDMIKFSGPGFKGVDNRLMALALVQAGLTHAALFTADGEVVHADEVLHKKPILVERGRFRPVTRATVDMLECARARFLQEPLVQGEEAVILMEMTLRNLAQDGTIDPRDFLDRVDLLGSLGQTVLISDFGPLHPLASHLCRYTKKMIGVATGVRTLRDLFETKHYAHLEGGILESFGRLFKNALKVYVYPYRDPVSGELFTADTLQVAPHLRHLYAHLRENRLLEPLDQVREECLPIFSNDVLARMRAGDASWESMVPSQVAQLIKQRQMFGYTEGGRTGTSIAERTGSPADPDGRSG